MDSSWIELNWTTNSVTNTEKYKDILIRPDINAVWIIMTSSGMDPGFQKLQIDR